MYMYRQIGREEEGSSTVARFEARVVKYFSLSPSSRSTSLALAGSVTAFKPSAPLREEGGGGEYSEKNWVEVSGQLPRAPTLIMIKICDCQYPVYDLTLNQ